jgi:stalled ribosome alternative rescue factor ArfA
MKKTLTSRSPYAKMLENKVFRNRIVAPRKGKGSYNRNKLKNVA